MKSKRIRRMVGIRKGGVSVIAVQYEDGEVMQHSFDGRMRIYVAHPYTGDEEKSRKLALDAEEALRKATPNVEFFNPVGRMTEQFKALPYVKVMNRYLAELASCDGIVLCGDWKNSPGCCMDAKQAKMLKMLCWYGVDAYVKNWARVESKAEYEEEMAT